MADTTRSPGRAAGSRPTGAGAVRQRRQGAAAGSSSSGTVRTRANANSAGMWRFATEDSTGLKIGPVPVLVLSLVFIGSVFILHMWGKYTRSTSA